MKYWSRCHSSSTNKTKDSDTKDTSEQHEATG